MPPNAPTVTGRAAIETVFRTRFATVGVLPLTSMDAQISGSQGFSAGTLTVTVPQAGGGTQVVPAKYLTILKRVGNEWKIAYDMQNPDQSPAR